MRMRKKMLRTVVALVASIMMAISGMINPLGGIKDSYVVHADATVSSWEELKAEIDNGGTQIITLGSDFPYNGQSIVLPQDSDITIKGSATIYSSNQDKYEPMFMVASGAKLTIDEGVTLSAKTSLDDAGCTTDSTYTADKFTGDVSTDGKTYSPKGFFIHVESGGNALLNGTISDFVTSRDKATTPRYVAPVVANGSGAVFNIGEKGVIKNNVVGYIVKDEMANNDAQTIKQYVKGAPPNVPRVPNAATQKANKSKFGNRPRGSGAGIDDGVPGSGITATAGAVIYKDGARGSIEGTIENNRGDTGGIMSSGSNTTVTIKDKTTITKNVGVQFGGGSTAEQGGSIAMTGGVMTENVAWFGGGAVFATENGVDWLLGRMNGDDGLTPQFGDRKDGQFFMTGGELTRNTAFTRGGAVLADSDGVNIQEGILAYNMGRMLGGAMYVMGDDPNYEYTVQMTGLYVHDNASVSGESETWGATAPTSTILDGEWGNGWANLNAPLQTLLQAPSTCADASDILSGTVTGGKAGGNTDDWTDGVGSQGTGGGVWLCAYGNTIFDANAPDKVVITNNWATGAPGAPFNPSGGAYHKTLNGSDLADAQNNSVPSTESRSGIASGSDFHADTGNKGKVSIGNLEPAQWVNENTGTKYVTEISDGRLNLVNKSTAPMPAADVKVQVYGNLSRHGGGLAADGTFIFGTGTDEATPSASMKVEKEWVGSVKKEAVTIITKVKTASGEVVDLAEVALDGEANPPATEFETIEELEPTGNTWNGKFNFPQNIETSSGTEKLYALVYTGPTVNTGVGGFDVIAGMELDPLTQKGKNALGAVLKAGYKDNIKILFGEPVYESTASEPKIVKEKTPGSGEYDYTPIEFLFEEWKVDESTGELKLCEDYIFLASEMDLANIQTNVVATPHYQTTYDPVTGDIVNTTTINYHIYLFEIPLTAPLSNDNWPITEKYVNKDVHSDIVNFDQEFVYDIMAYVPVSATEFTISDELVQGLEFADKDGNPSTDPWEVVQAVVVKYSNNHEVGEDGTVESGAVVKTPSGTPIDFIRWEKGWPDGEGYPASWVTAWPNQGYGPQMSISGNELTVKIDERGYNNGGNNPFDLQQARGRWVQVTFNARIKDEYRSLEALKALAAGTDGKTTSWEETDANKQAPDARDLTLVNGDLNIVKALNEMIGPDPIIWAVEGPSRLFARSERGDYYATPMDDKSGNTWTLLTEGTEDWNNADSRYNGRPPYANNTIRQIPLGDATLAALDTMPSVKGGKIEVAAEGPSRYFAKVIDGYGNVVYYQTDPLNDKTGKTWKACTDSELANAMSKIQGDKDTIRFLDLESDVFTLYGDGKNWPVISEEEHEGMANQGTYNVKFGNNAEGTYKTNTVTVKPETTELKVEKKWKYEGSTDWPANVDKVVASVYRVYEGKETQVYVDADGKYVGAFENEADAPDGAVPLTVELTKTKPSDTVTDLPMLKKTTYIAKETMINDIEITSDSDGNASTNISTDPSVEININTSTKDAYYSESDKLNKLADSEDITLLCGAEADTRLWALSSDGKYFFTEVGDTNGNKASSVWTEITKPADDADPTSAEVINYERAKALLGTVDDSGNITAPTEAGDDFFYTKSAYTFTNRKGEKPEIEKYVNKAVHKEIEMDEIFTYDVIAYVTKDADKVVITDTLDEVLRFADDASAIKVVDLGESNNHKVENSIEAIKVNNDATVSQAGTNIDEADVKIEGKKLTVTITNKLKAVTDDEGTITGYEYDGDVQPVKALRGHWVKVTFRAEIDDKTLDEVIARYKQINATDEEGRAKPNIGNDPVESDEDHKGVPNSASYTIGVANEADIEEDVYGDTSNTVTVKPNRKFTVKKTWDDRESSRRPAEITVHLYKDGVDTGMSAVLNDSNNWEYTFEELSSGEYTIKEDPVSYYFPEVRYTDEEIANLKNISRPWIPETPGDEFGGFHLTKTVSKSIAEKEPNKEYKFRVTMQEKSGKKIYEETVKLKADEIIEYDYVPADTVIHVEELTSGYKVTYIVEGEKSNECLIEVDKIKTMTVRNELIPEVPDTSDNSKMLMWGMIMGVALLIALGVGTIRFSSKQ